MSFISIQNGQLYADGKPLKFLSFNIPNFSLQETPWRRTTLYEQEDLFSSLAQMSATVARTYTFSFPLSASDKSKHIIVTGGFGTANCTWTLNEGLFQDFDRGIAVAAKYGISLIIPLIDTYEYWGGIASFASMCGAPGDSFYSDTVVRKEWISFITKVVTRNNTVTGIAYYSDPAILGWETINEGRTTANWTLSTAAALKAIDKNHLVIDGSYGLYGWDDSILQSSLIDVVSNHYYPLALNVYAYTTLDFIAISLTTCCFALTLITLLILKWCPWRIPLRLRITHVLLTESSQQDPAGKLLDTQKVVVKTCSWVLFILIFFISLGLLAYFILAPVLIRGLDFSARLKSDCSTVKGKPFIIGEFGLAPFKSLEGLAKALPTSCASGALLWSLRGHSSFGGFYTHEELGGYLSYHFPGFPPNKGFGSDEEQVVNMANETSKLLSTTASQNMNTPLPPYFLLSNYTVLKGSPSLISISWLGCAGCSNYNVYAASSSTSFILASGIMDNYPSGQFNYNITITGPDVEYKSLQVEGLGRWGSTGKSPSVPIVNIQ